MCDYVQVPDSREALAWAAAWSAGFPSLEMLCVGVTGTSGKTTTTYILESILRAAGHTPGLIGTVEIRYAGQVQEATHTTPGPVELQRTLRAMREAGCSAVVMEVSSHALAQRRADFIAWDGMAFTNLSAEHLDYHADLEDYFGAKLRLFTDCAERSREAQKNPVAAVCTDDAWGKRLADELARSGIPRSVSASGKTLHPRETLHGTEGKFGELPFRARLRGDFNASNLALALELAYALGVSREHCVQGVEALPGVPGRLEAVEVPGVAPPFAVCVDYAHKPDALQKVLRAIRPGTRGRVLTVFGCGGDRDRTKRPLMGAIAAEASDLVWVTSDNPRTEEASKIIEEILEGIPAVLLREKIRVEPDRARAIEQAITEARAGDFVLIAGKGHETYQIIGKEKRPFDDREHARNALRRLTP